MKEFLKALLYVVPTQAICWGIFTLCDEFPSLDRSNAELLALTFGVVSTITVLVLYFIFEKKIIAKHKLSPVKFNIFLLVAWAALSLYIAYTMVGLVENGVLHVCTSSGWMACFLNGIEYFFYGALLTLAAPIAALWQIARAVYQFFKQKKSHQRHNAQKYPHADV